MEILLIHIAPLSMTARIVTAFLGLCVIRGAFHLLEWVLPRRPGHSGRRYRARKVLTATAYIAIFVFIAVLFADRLKQMGLPFGLLGAGIVVALQDIISSIGGFLAITFSSLYRVGDRIQVNETKGDVLDISLMRTTLLEIGNWVSGDLYNGRIVRIPNSTVLKGLVFNYSQGFRFVWDEIKIRLKSESDQWQARDMLLRVGKETASDYLVEAREAWKHVVENYPVENPLFEPTVMLNASGGTLEFSLSYIVDYTLRNVVKDRLFTRIVDNVANSNGALEWAPSSTTVLLKTGAADLREPLNLIPGISGIPR